MKAIPRLLRLAVAAWLGACQGAAGSPGTRSTGNDLTIEFEPRFAGTPLTFDALSNVTSAGQEVSVTRLDFLISELALRHRDGTWLRFTNAFAYISARENRTRFTVDGVPPGGYDRVSFSIGVPPAINHSDVAGYAPGHPLNPDVNGLYWGWMGGYVFLALEGRWNNPNSGGSDLSGYSYHLATDRLRMRVERSVLLNIATGAKLRLALNVDRIFDGPPPLVLGGANLSTHSRTNDPLVAVLAAKVEQSFTVLDDSTTTAPIVAAAHAPTKTSTLDFNPQATLYRFTYSALFPQPALPRDNPLTEQGVALGRRLFFDPQLSINNSQSCASCHRVAAAFTEPKSVSTGAEGGRGTRNAMALLNLAWKSSFFWDGRAASLREQVLQPIQNPIEMHENLSHVVAKLSAASSGDDAGYLTLFQRAFGTPVITADRIARALEQFLLVQTSYHSKFDRLVAGEARFTPEEQRGFELFHTEYDPRRGQFGADCFHCHGGPLFMSQAYANNGLDAEFKDIGRAAVTHRDGDRGKFAVPSLRNVELTAPYMHDGRFATLEQVVEHYCTGMKRSATLDPNLAKHPDGGVPLSDADKKALVAFLKTLTDRNMVSAPSQVLAGLPQPTPGLSQADGELKGLGPTLNHLAIRHGGVGSQQTKQTKTKL